MRTTFAQPNISYGKIDSSSENWSEMMSGSSDTFPIITITQERRERAHCSSLDRWRAPPSGVGELWAGAEARRSIPVGGWVSGAGAPGAQAATGSPYILDVYTDDPDRRIGASGGPVPCTGIAAEKIIGPSGLIDDYRSSGASTVEGCLFCGGMTVQSAELVARLRRIGAC